VLALNDYLRASGELQSAISYELTVNGTSVTRQSIAPSDVLRAPRRFVIDPAIVRDGRNEVRISRTGGSGDLYFAAEATYFSLAEPVRAAGNEIFVRREYYRLAGRPTLLSGYVYDRVALRDGEAVRSGERIEVVLTVETKNDYEYLVFEDLKPAGFEAVALRSGEALYATRTGAGADAAAGRTRVPGGFVSSRRLHQELRDRKVALFADRLETGMWEIRYTLRAEVPGSFHALPLLGHAMYVPEIRANGDEVRVRVTE
jgi:alpha-2-macroglobulin